MEKRSCVSKHHPRSGRTFDEFPRFGGDVLPRRAVEREAAALDPSHDLARAQTHAVLHERNFARQQRVLRDKNNNDSVAVKQFW